MMKRQSLCLMDSKRSGKFKGQLHKAPNILMTNGSRFVIIDGLPDIPFMFLYPNLLTIDLHNRLFLFFIVRNKRSN